MVLRVGLIIFLSLSHTLLASADWTHFGLRPLAMGNAFVSISDDFNALFYNPAGLATVESWDGEFLNPRFTVSHAAIGLADDFVSSQSSSLSDTERGVEFLEIFEKNLGVPSRLSMQFTPHLIFPHFGIGLGVDIGQVEVTVHRQLEFDVSARSGFTMPISYAHSFLADQLHLGVSVKPILEVFSIDEQKLGLEAFEKISKGVDGLKDFLRSGFGVGIDFGLLFQPKIPMSPSIGFSFMDIGDTSFKKVTFSSEVPVSAPRLRKAAVNVGFSLTPFTLAGLELKTAIDFHRINQVDSFSKKLNIGVEANYNDWIRLGTGLHQGYLTAGLDFDVGLFGLKFATYQVERSTYAGSKENLSDRRYSAEIHILL